MSAIKDCDSKGLRGAWFASTSLLNNSDKITANTQAVTHLAFLSMGSAWRAEGNFPWEDSTYIGGIDNVKTIMALRIYANKWHVYSVNLLQSLTIRASLY